MLKINSQTKKTIDELVKEYLSQLSNEEKSKEEGMYGTERERAEFILDNFMEWIKSR